MRNAKATASMFPQKVNYLCYPVVKGGVPPSTKGFVHFLQDLEDRLRGGERLYVFSKDGNGRVGLVAGSLLGRMYGCPVPEAMWRLQFCHDCMRSIKAGTSVNISCPSNIHQAHFVREVLTDRETEYEPFVKVQGKKSIIVLGGGASPTQEQKRVFPISIPSGRLSSFNDRTYFRIPFLCNFRPTS